MLLNICCSFPKTKFKCVTTANKHRHWWSKRGITECVSVKFVWSPTRSVIRWLYYDKEKVEIHHKYRDVKTHTQQKPSEPWAIKQIGPFHWYYIICLFCVSVCFIKLAISTLFWQKGGKCPLLTMNDYFLQTTALIALPLKRFKLQCCS